MIDLQGQVWVGFNYMAGLRTRAVAEAEASQQRLARCKPHLSQRELAA